jgi:Bacteriophage tail sheath protein
MPTVLNYPGVYIEELPSAVRTITGVPTSIAAFVGRAWKGPVDTPVTVNSLADYERTFGGLWTGSSMSYAIAQFFANGGGQAIVVRVVNRTDGAGSAATRTKFAINGGTKLEALHEGTWGNDLELTVDTTPNPDLPADPGRFHLTVLDSPDRREDSAKRGGSGAQESYPNVSVTPSSPRFILRVLAEQSKLIRVQDGLAANVGGSAPGGNATVTSTNAGRDGSDITTSDVKGASGAGTGMYALSRADLFNLLCLPPPTVGGDHDTALWADAAAFCKQERAVVLVDAVRTWDVATAATSVVAAPFGNISAKSNAALYFPRLRMPDPLAENALTDFAPCGVVAGVIARTDSERGVWKAPAGIEASVAGVFGTSVNGAQTTLIDADSAALNPVAVNVIRDVPGVGPVVWGARTMDGRDLLASQWKYLPVRRVALYIEESLYRGTQWVVFEPNDEPLWAQIRLNVGTFMHGLFRQGAFQGTSPRDAYLVKCDRETTTQDDINRGVVNILVGFAPLKPAEFVVLKIQQLAGQIQA